jgi:hypothetical protein
VVKHWIALLFLQTSNKLLLNSDKKAKTALLFMSLSNRVMFLFNPLFDRIEHLPLKSSSTIGHQKAGALVKRQVIAPAS